MTLSSLFKELENILCRRWRVNYNKFGERERKKKRKNKKTWRKKTERVGQVKEDKKEE